MTFARTSALAAVLAVTFRWAAVKAHPLCFYGDRPTDYQQDLTFCPADFQDDGACCSDAEEAAAEALYNSAAPTALTGECANLYKQVACGPCHSFSAHLYERLGGELGPNDGMTMKGNFCDNLVDACQGQITFPTYDGASYCEKHVGSTGDQFWSYPYTSTSNSDGSLEPLFDESMYESGALPPDVIALQMTPDGDEWWVAGQSGLMVLVKVSSMGASTEIMDMSDNDDFYLAFEEGLLGFCHGPMFSSNKRFYVSYTAVKSGGTTHNTLSRFDYVAGNTGATLGSEELLVQSSARSTSIHAGGWVGFKPSDYGSGGSSHDIYWSAGDSGPQTDPQKHGQNVNDLHSTIVRISVPTTGTGYTIPSGNLGTGLPEICAYGLRNPFRCGFDTATDELFCGDVGHTFVEAIYKIECGKNYGWGRFEGSRCQEAVENLYDAPCDGVDRSGIEMPIFEYCHPSYYSDTKDEEAFTGGNDICGDRTIVGNGAIGGYVYHGDYYNDVLAGAYVFGDTDPQNNLYYLKVVNGEWVQGTIVGDGSVNVISFAQDNSGEIYVITRNKVGGGVYDWRVYLLPCGDLCFSTCLPQGDAQDIERVGCFGNPNPSDRVLTLTPESECPEKQQAMNPAVCASYCATEGATFSGVEFGYQCWCGAVDAEYDKYGLLPEEECTMSCTGFPAATCGGVGAIEIYTIQGPSTGPSTGPTTPTPPTPTPDPVGDYVFEGCFADFQEARLLSNLIEDDDKDMTTEVCAGLCEGSTYFGTEYGIQCFCSVEGDLLDTDAGICNYDCGGDSTQKCGGFGAITVYSYGDAGPPVPSPVDGETPAPMEGEGEGPVEEPTNGPVEEYTFQGCFEDLKNDRVLSNLVEDDGPDMTNAACAALCSGSTYFGTEYGKQCFCSVKGDELDHKESTACNFKCTGDTSQTCGGFDAISVYSFGGGAPAPPAPAPVEASKYTYMGCFADSKDNRLLSGDETKDTENMSTDLCAELCPSSKYFGTQYGMQCFCGTGGDTLDTEEGECTYSCVGDSSAVCGGFDAISVYEK